MTEALQQEIRTLRSLHNSERDPEGRVFAPLADAYRRAGEIPEAVRLLNDGLTRLPDFVPGHVVAAQLYVEQGLAEEAGLAARRALDLDPDNVNALRSLLRVLEDKGDAQEASRVRDHLIALEPGFAAEHAAAATGGAPLFVSDGAVEPPATELQDTLVLDTMGDAHEDAAVSEPVGGEDFGFAESDIGLGALPLVPSGADEEEPSSWDEDGPLEAEAAWELTLEPEPDSHLHDLSGEAAVDESTAPALGRPEPPEEERVFDLDALAPNATESAEDEPVDFGLLTADEPEAVAIDSASLPEAEPVFDFGALAPDEPEEPVLDMAALAPDEPEEPVLDMAALAPDEPEEPVLDMAALAPDEPEEPVLDMAALAPDEPEEPVLEMAALAPDEPVLDMDQLAPDALEDAAPAGNEAADFAFLSRSEPDDVVIDLDALRPDHAETGAGAEDPLEPFETPSVGEPVAEVSSAAAEDLEEPAGLEANEEEGEAVNGAVEADEANEDADDGEPVYSRTLAELYVKQGAVGRALRVLRHLHAADPGNRELAERIAELEEGGDVAAPAPLGAPAGDRRAWRPDEQDEDEPVRDADEEVESLARDLAQSGDEGHDVDSPFSWGEREVEAPADGQSIRDYFDGLLSWEPGEER